MSLNFLMNCHGLQKLFFALPFLDWIAWGIYRVAKGVTKKDNLQIIIGIIWIFSRVDYTMGY